MSTASARLLAHRCCIRLLLSVIIFILVETQARTTPSLPGKEYTGHHSSLLDSLKGKCQFNLTDSSHSLEANSSIYQNRGFLQCEYLIQAPRSRFILLNFTDIRSQSDMIVGPGARRQEIQQAGTPPPPPPPPPTTTTPLLESQFSQTLFKKPLDENSNVNTTRHHSHKVNQHLSSTQGTYVGDPNPSHIKGTYNSNSSEFQNHYTNDSSKRQSAASKSHISSSSNEQKLSQDTHILSSTKNQEPNLEAQSGDQSNLNKDFGSLPTSGKGSYLELSTSARLPKGNNQADSLASNHNCSLKLIIEEVNGTSGSSSQVICWGKSWQARIPIVFQYSVPIRITYVWDRRSQSGFSLDFTFLRPEEVDYCLFRCNNLCLPKQQLCDGHFDCLDHSDEHSSACNLISQQEDGGDPSIIKVIVIAISIIIGVVIALAFVFMINHCRCYDAAHRGGGSLLQPPHSHSSEVCRSPSGSIQESGQYEPMLHPPQQRQAVSITLAAASSNCSEHQQLLHPHQLEVEQQHHHHQQQQQQQPLYQHHSSRNHSVSQPHYMSQEHQLRSLSSKTQYPVVVDNSRLKRQLQYQLQQKCVHHPQQQLEQQQQQQQQSQCKQAHRHVSPSELYPPNIPLSADGEEGYAMSQRALHSKQQLERNWQAENEVFRPPPNKTVFDRDSPPPPYSLNPPGTKSLDSLVPPVGAVCVLRQTRSNLMHQGSPTGVPRSHSLSCHH